MATDVTQRPLPEADFSGHPNGPNRTSAYTIIQRAEREAEKSQNTQHLMSARVVGFMFLEFHNQLHILGDLPCSTLTKWVTSPPTEKGANDCDVVYGLGESLREKFIRLYAQVRTSTARYKLPSSHPSRPSFDMLEDMIRDTLEPSEQCHTSPRQKALARDGFRCMITGIFDENSVKHCPGLLDQALQEGSGTLEAVIETAHILNESTMHGIDPEGTGKTSTPHKTEHAAAAMAMLKSFGFSGFASAFSQSGGVHEVWNLLSLHHDLHRNFDALNLWFEHTDKPGRYSIRVSKPTHEDFIRITRNFQRPGSHVAGAPIFVEFTSQFENAPPPPHPLLLALHAACARVAHTSGAAEHFDKLDRDEEDIKVLARDGSNAALLSHLLSPFGAPEAECYVETAA